MTIKVGDSLPEATFFTPSANGPQPLTTAEVFAGKKVVLFGVPGAFTPTCSNNHMPGYVQHHDAIKAKGVDTIAVVSVNDAHVMKAWGEATSATGKITCSPTAMPTLPGRSASRWMARPLASARA